MLIKLIQNKNKIAVLGKGGIGKSFLSSSLALQMVEFGLARDNLYKLIYTELDGSSSFNIEDADEEQFLQNIEKGQINKNVIPYQEGLHILRLPNDLDMLRRADNNGNVHKLIQNLSKKYDTIANFHGDNGLDSFLELADLFDDIIIITGQEESARNTVIELIQNLYRYLEEKEDFRNTFNRIYLICNKLTNEKYAHYQFKTKGKQNIGLKYVNNRLFSYYEELLQKEFSRFKPPKNIEFDIHPKSKIAEPDIKFIPLFNVVKDSNIYQAKKEFRIYITDYLNIDMPNEEDLPLAVKAIRSNARYILDNFK